MRWFRSALAITVFIALSASCGWVAGDKHTPRGDNGLPLVEPVTDFVAELRDQPFLVVPTIRFSAGAPPEVDYIIDPNFVRDHDYLELLGIIQSYETEIHFAAALEYRSESFGRCCPVVVAPLADPDLTAVLMAHELAHLLDSRYFPDRDASDDPQIEQWTFTRAVIEGNATRIEQAYEDHLGGWLSLRETYSARQPAGFDPKIRRIYDFPYIQGAVLTKAIAEAQGERGINDALREPPRSAEQVMFPQAFLARDEPVTVALGPLPADQQQIRSGTIGTFLLMLMLEPVAGEPAATELVRSWAGDSYRVANIGTATCLTANIVMDDSLAATALADAFKAGFLFGVQEIGTSVVIERCV